MNTPQVVTLALLAALALLIAGCANVETHEYDPVTESHIADGLRMYQEDIARAAGAPSVVALEAEPDQWFPVGDLTYVEYQAAVDVRRDHLLYERVKMPDDDNSNASE